jgi:hypothetical protein
MVLRILGLIALGALGGALIGVIATPFILQLIVIVAYALASTIAVILKRRTWRESFKGFPPLANPLNTIIHPSHCKEHTISYAKPIPDFRDDSNGIVYRNVVSHPPMTEKPSTTPRQTANYNALDAVNQPTFKKASTIFHRIILFYRSYYGHSTKVEKNLLVHMISDTFSFLLFC